MLAEFSGTLKESLTIYYSDSLCTHITISAIRDVALRATPLRKSVMRIVSSTVHRPCGSLIDFAMFFHQDFGIQFKRTEDGIDEYLSYLSKAQKTELKIAIEKFVESLPVRSQRGLKNAWIKLGACYWDKRLIEITIDKLQKYSP